MIAENELQRQEEQRRQRVIRIEKLRQKQLELLYMYPEFETIAVYYPKDKKVKQNKADLISGILKKDSYDLISELKMKAAYDIYKQKTPTQINEGVYCFNCTLKNESEAYRIGYLQFNEQRSKQKHIQISEFFVDKPARSTEISDFLIKSAIYHIKYQYGLDIHLTVDLDNDRAKRFFEQNGFKLFRVDSKKEECYFKLDISKTQPSQYLKWIPYDRGFNNQIDDVFSIYQQKHMKEKQILQQNYVQ